jgi:hypothetical protein
VEFKKLYGDLLGPYASPNGVALHIQTIWRLQSKVSPQSIFILRLQALAAALEERYPQALSASGARKQDY